MLLFVLIFTYLVVVNLITYRAFAKDKKHAIEKRRRTPEATLLLWAAAGGWLGAKIAQQRLRHKSHKQPFGRLLNLIGLLFALAIAALVLGAGTQLASRNQDPKVQIDKQKFANLTKYSLRPPVTRPSSESFTIT